MHPLDGARLKVNRAKTEIDRLGLMQDAFFKNTHYSVVSAEQNLESGKNVYRIKIDGSPPPLDWGIYIGEIAHNLRSALNYLVYQLALLNSLNEPKTVAQDTRLQFPIFVAKWSGCDSPLFWLEEINNADKHRIIQVAGVKAGGFGTTWWGERDNAFIGGTFGILEDGAKFGEATPDVPMDVQIRPLIAFANGCDVILSKPVCLLLNMVATTVSEIVESFASEF